MVFSLSGAVVPTRGRRATLPARPRPPAAAARDLQSPRRAQEVRVESCKLFRVHLIRVLGVVRASTRGEGV